MGVKYYLKIFTLPLIVFCACMAYLLWFLDETVNLYEFYSLNIRTSLFTGFLTIGGFFLTLKTFILVKLKEDLYDLEDYRDRIRSKQAINPKITMYGPLSRLGGFLIYCVLFSILTATFQLSVWFIKTNVAAAICISSGFATISMVVWAWWEIKKNISVWFEMLEKKEKNK